MAEFYSIQSYANSSLCFCRWNIRVCCDWFLCTGDDGSPQCFTSTHSCLRLLHLNVLNVKHVFTNLVMQFHEIIYLLMYLFHYFTYLINCDLSIYLIDLIITSFIQCLYFIFYLIYFSILFYFTFFTFNKHTNLTNMVKKKSFQSKVQVSVPVVNLLGEICVTSTNNKKRQSGQSGLEAERQTGGASELMNDSVTGLPHLDQRRWSCQDGFPGLLLNDCDNFIRETVADQQVISSRRR